MAILAPVLLSNGPATGEFRMGEHLAIAGLSRIPRADVADALLRCLDDTTTVHKRFLVAP
jgi:putative NADH-flavin reductase